MTKPNRLFHWARPVCAGLAMAVAAAMLSGAAARAASAPAGAHGLLSVRLKLGDGRGPAVVATLGVPTAGLDTLQASLNGHPVAVPPVTGSGAERALNLAELGRLRFGTNRLRVRVVMLDGAVQSFSRTFTVGAHRDIAVARVLTPATTGHTAVLDASRSLLVPGTGGLATAHWKLVRRPTGSHARLGSATGAQVVLRPDVPGYYLIALRVGSGSHTGVDLLKEDVTYPELLVPFNTIAQDHAAPFPNPGIQIENSFYVDPTVGHSYGTLQMLVLNRSTLGYVANYGVNGNVDGISLAIHYLEDYYNSPNYLVILTHPGPEYVIPPIPDGSSDALETLLGLIGGTVPAQWQFGRSDCWSDGTENCYGDSAAWKRNAMYGGSFTYIGVPGMPAGQAWRETAVQLGQPDGNGPITGYFTRGSLAGDGTDDYTVVVGPRPFVPVQTCTADVCGVQVGDHTYAPDAGVSNGMHVVVLDRTTLKLITNTTVTTTGQLDSALQTGTPPVVGHYIAAPGVDDRRVVIIQSIGDGQLSGTVSPQLLARINQFGGTPDYLWYAMSPGHVPACRYALIGTAADLPWQGTAAESSTAMKHGYTSASGPDCAKADGLPTGQLDGVLQRGRDGLYTPGAANPSGVTDNSLYQILYSPGWYQPDQAWPMDDDIKGLKYVADHIGLCPGGANPCYSDVRSAYTNDGIDFESKLSLLVGLPADCQPSECGPDFPALKEELKTEFDWVNNVRLLVSNLQKPYLANQGSFSVESVTNTVKGTLHVADDNRATMQWLKIYSQIPGIGKVIAKAAGEGPVADVFGALSAAGNIATATLTPSNGSQADSVTAKAGDLASQIYQQQLAYLEWTGLAEGILASTYQQLHAAGTKIWSFDGVQFGQQVAALQASAAASAYSALLPAAWGGYNLKPGPTLSGSDDVSTYLCTEVGPSLTFYTSYPFKPALPEHQYHAITSVSGSGQAIRQVWTFANTSGFEDYAHPAAAMPGNLVTDYIYGPNATVGHSNGNYGAFQYEASWWRSTYNPPSHTICNTSAYYGHGNPKEPLSTAWPPPPIAATPPP